MKHSYVFSLLVLAACGSHPAGADPTCSGAAPYAARGPFASGVTTLDAGGVAVEVWYPVDRGAEAGKPRARYDMRDWLPAASRARIPDADAPIQEMDAYRDLVASRARRFPVVLFSHGLGGYRMQSSFLMTHLASWGFVVAAPEHVERGLAVVLTDLKLVDAGKATDQMRAALAMLRAEDAKAEGALAARLDLSHVAVTGHSMGGLAVAQMLADGAIGAGVLLASGGFGDGVAGKPLLMMGGSADGIATVPTLEDSFAKQPAGKRYVSIRDAGHLAFTDLCVIGRDRGGVVQIAIDHGLAVSSFVQRLANDGCQPEDLPAEKAWPLIDHYVTAELRAAFAIDAAPRGLDDKATSCFGDHVASFRQQ